MLLFHKILPALFLPLTLALACLCWGLWRRRRGAVLVGFLMLVVASQPLVGRALMRWAEGGAVRRAVEQVMDADAVVVLSAGRGFPPGTSGVTEWRDANRFFAGVELAHAGKAPVLVFTAARAPWEPAWFREGDVLAVEAARLGIAADRILVTDTVENTADEASAVLALLARRGVIRPRVVLVTSAFHLRRAQALFEQAGVRVEGFPVDFVGGADVAFTAIDLVPSPVALADTHTALREAYGRAFYGLRAWWRARTVSD